jgi:hypothetical protein
VPLCPSLSSTLCPIIAFLTFNNPISLFQYVHCCLLEFVHNLLELRTLRSGGSVSLCPLLYYIFCRIPVCISQCTVCWVCHCVHYCLLQSVHSLSVPHTVPSVGSVSLCPILPSTLCPLSVSTSHCTACWFCATMSTTVFYSLFTFCQYLTLYRLLVLCHYVHYCLLQSVHCLSVPHNVPSVGCVSLWPLLFSTVSPLSVYLIFLRLWFCVTMSSDIFFLLPTHYLPHTVLLLILCHYIHCYFT